MLSCKSRIGRIVRGLAAHGARLCRWSRPASREFTTSGDYWEERYAGGGNSGAGSYGELATYKAQVLNDFVRDEKIETVVEFGCGDGNQLSLLKLPHYTGLDISATAVERLQQRYAGDPTKQFVWIGNGSTTASIPRSDLALSLDVLYHLVEDSVYTRYLEDLFAAARRYVIIYSSNYDEATAPHVRHRHFTDDIAAKFPEWELVKTLENPHRDQTPADFFIFRRKGGK